MLKRAFILFLVSTFFLSTIPLYAAGPLDLSPLVEEAKNSNPEILATKKRYEAAKARIPQAKSLEDPVIGLKFEKAERNPFNLDTAPAMDRMLSFSQMLPWFGKLPLKGKIALVESQAFAAEYKDKELEIINEVKNTYYGLFMNYKEIELSEESLEFLKGIAAIADAKYVVGDVTQEELFKISLEIARLSNNIRNLKREQSAKNTRLNSLLNRQPEAFLGAPELGDDFSFSVDIDSLYRQALENQPALLIFSYAIEKNKYAKSLAKKSFFPDLMTGIVMRGLSSGNIGPWDLMLAFSVPLWFWTKQRYEVKEAVANLEEAQAAYQAMKNKVLAETKESATRIEISKNKISLYKTDLIPILEASISSSLAAYRSGKGDLMMLLDNERMLVETKMNYYQSLVDYNINLSDLERNVGLDLREVKK